MTKRIIIVAGLVFASAPAWSALRLGLGNAVAKRSADLINKASAQAKSRSATASAATLPHCSSGALSDSLPIEMNKIGGIDPLGHVQPTGHTFPADHIYYYSSTTTVYSPAVYAPGNITVTSVASSSNLSATPVYTDYTLTFYACQEFRAVYGHVKTLDPSLFSQAGAMSSCQTYVTGGNTFQLCTANTNFTMHSGDLDRQSRALQRTDFGASDDRVSLSYVSPARRGPNQLHTVCPVDYFVLRGRRRRCRPS